MKAQRNYEGSSFLGNISSERVALYKEHVRAFSLATTMWCRRALPSTKNTQQLQMVGLPATIMPTQTRSALCESYAKGERGYLQKISAFRFQRDPSTTTYLITRMILIGSREARLQSLLRGSSSLPHIAPRQYFHDDGLLSCKTFDMMLHSKACVSTRYHTISGNLNLLLPI